MPRVPQARAKRNTTHPGLALRQVKRVAPGAAGSLPSRPPPRPIPPRKPFAAAETARPRDPFSTPSARLCETVTNRSHQPAPHRVAHRSLNRKFPCCTASDLPDGPPPENVFLPQQSQGSGGVREAFLRRSAERNGTCTRTEPSGPQDRMRTQAEPPGLRSGRSRKRVDRAVWKLETVEGPGSVAARGHSHRAGGTGAIRDRRNREGVRRCADRVQAPGAFFRSGTSPYRQAPNEKRDPGASESRLTCQSMHPRPSTGVRIPRRISVWQQDIA
jgi:hypothetical protein